MHQALRSTGRTPAAYGLRRCRPGFACFVVVFAASAVIGWRSVRNLTDIGAINWYTSIVWTLPVFLSLLGMTGAWLTAARLRRTSRIPSPEGVVGDRLVVVVPTIGRVDTCPALERVVHSFLKHLPRNFLDVRVDLLVEEDCEAGELIDELGEAHSAVRVIKIPPSYRTPAGTRFKARANHYAHELRLAEGEARSDVWVLHMDDDTAVGPDTATALAHFISAQAGAGDEARHLAQGILSFPRELAVNGLVWLADAVRPGCDLSLFAATTGVGSPCAGLHGELLLVRASVEATIGWDFGPGTIVEDAQFALEFCARYPGGSAWVEGRSYGASPATLSDFLRQRERWVWGLVGLATNRAIPLRRRLVLLQAVGVWTCASAQNPALVFLVACLSHSSTAPVVVGFVPIWSLNFAFCVWLYWEGLKVNAAASASGRRLWWEPIVLVLLLPVFSVLEAVGATRGLLTCLLGRDARFTVIAKPA